ncbi:zinc finger BED domain-containing protein RICESLEEPER 2-like protein [Tanacetum coccineum]
MHDCKSELDRYLNEDVEDESDKFDILNWWKVNSPRFPVLSLLARDVLVIPISTVASESVFSTGGRVLDAFRSSLTPPVVESLICTQDWFRENSMGLDVAENWDEIQKIEEDNYIYTIKQACERGKQCCLRWSSEDDGWFFKFEFVWFSLNFKYGLFSGLISLFVLNSTCLVLVVGFYELDMMY